MSMSTLASEFHRLADPVNSSAPSNTKWSAVERLVAEALAAHEDDVYAATVNKAGNLSVRMVQSKNARSSVALVMWTGPDETDFDRTISAVQKHLVGRQLVLVARRDLAGTWRVVAALAPGGNVPAAITSAWAGVVVMPL